MSYTEKDDSDQEDVKIFTGEGTSSAEKDEVANGSHLTAFPAIRNAGNNNVSKDGNDTFSNTASSFEWNGTSKQSQPKTFPEMVRHLIIEPVNF